MIYSITLITLESPCLYVTPYLSRSGVCPMTFPL